MLVRMRYCVVKPNRNGSVRWYWQRPGFPTRRLPDGEAERYATARTLNERADTERAEHPARSEPLFGTVSWAVATYRTSAKYTGLAPRTRRTYQRWMIALEETVGREPITALTRRAVREILDGIESPGAKVHCGAVLAKVCNVAWEYELLNGNPAVRLGLSQARRRDRVWSDDDIAAFLEACAGERLGDAVALAFTLLLHTAQRPGDVRRMTWAAYDGSTIRLRQQKTHKALAVPCVAELRAALDAAKAKATGVTIVAQANGKPLSETLWFQSFGRIRAKAGIEDLQARDLRRTAIVRLAMAGCSAPEIASVSGHGLEATERILEVYLPRTAAMAKGAIAKLEQYRG